VIPQRDIGSEVVVAIAVVAVLTFALVFGILLTLSSNSGNPISSTPAVQVSTTSSEITDLPESTTPTATVTIVFPTDVQISHTVTPEQTAIPSPDDTATREPTVTSTMTITPTTRAIPTRTVINTVAASHTPTFTLTATFTPTQTPTVTFTRTETAIPTPTPTSTATPTFTSTASRTASPTRTPTFTPLPTETSGIRPTPSHTPSVTGTVTLVSCVRPKGWSNYIVQPGNTLFSIARSVGSTVRELSRVNCIVNADRILTGDVLYVPTLPPEPVKTGIIATSAPHATYASLGCGDPAIAAITNLVSGQRLSKAVTLQGTATIEDFWYYKVEVRPDFASEYNFYFRSENPVARANLGTLDPGVFGPGLHWVRLVVVKQDASVPPSAVCVIPVNFE
jgi:LysM repeat protein